MRRQRPIFEALQTASALKVSDTSLGRSSIAEGCSERSRFRPITFPQLGFASSARPVCCRSTRTSSSMPIKQAFGSVEHRVPVGGQRATNSVQATLDPQKNLLVAYSLDYDGSRCSRASGSATNGSNRCHGDSAGSSGASSLYRSQRGSASRRSRSKSFPRRGSRGNDRGTSKYSTGWRDSNDQHNGDQHNGYTQAGQPEDSKTTTLNNLRNLNLSCYSCQDTFCRHHSAYPSVEDASNPSPSHTHSPPWGTASAMNNNLLLTEA
jgi:hypothetical protein